MAPNSSARTLKFGLCQDKETLVTTLMQPQHYETERVELYCEHTLLPSMTTFGDDDGVVSVFDFLGRTLPNLKHVKIVFRAEQRGRVHPRVPGLPMAALGRLLCLRSDTLQTIEIDLNGKRAPLHGTRSDFNHALHYLSKATSLRKFHLCISALNITDATNLRGPGTAFTETLLRSLSQMETLEHVSIHGTKATLTASSSLATICCPQQNSSNRKPLRLSLCRCRILPSLIHKIFGENSRLEKLSLKDMVDINAATDAITACLSQKPTVNAPKIKELHVKFSGQGDPRTGHFLTVQSGLKLLQAVRDDNNTGSMETLGVFMDVGSSSDKYGPELARTVQTLGSSVKRLQLFLRDQEQPQRAFQTVYSLLEGLDENTSLVDLAIGIGGGGGGSSGEKKSNNCTEDSSFQRRPNLNVALEKALENNFCLKRIGLAAYDNKKGRIALPLSSTVQCLLKLNAETGRRRTFEDQEELIDSMGRHKEDPGVLFQLLARNPTLWVEANTARKKRQHSCHVADNDIRRVDDLTAPSTAPPPQKRPRKAEP